MAKETQLYTSSMKISEETHRDKNWIFYNNYEVNHNGVKTFIGKSIRITEQQYNKVFGILDNPITHLKNKYNWDIDIKKWEALVNIYNSDINKLVWDLYESTPDSKDITTVVDILLTGIQLSNRIIKEYILAVQANNFTKQDGKDILTRLASGELPANIYLDSKYKKINNIEEVVTKLFESNKDRFQESKSIDKMLAWLVGQVMKETKGKCDPAEVKQFLKRLINETC